MLDILLVVHAVIALLLISVILLQRNAGDGLAGLGGSGGGNNMGVVTARSAANFMTRVTVILATLFIVNSLVLANLSNKTNKDNRIKNAEIQKQIDDSDDSKNKKATQQLPIAD